MMTRPLVDVENGLQQQQQAYTAAAAAAVAYTTNQYNHEYESTRFNQYPVSYQQAEFCSPSESTANTEYSNKTSHNQNIPNDYEMVLFLKINNLFLKKIEKKRVRSFYEILLFLSAFQ